MARGHDLIGLTVLAVLSIRDSHPYELQQFIVNTRKDYVTGLPRSLYHAVDRLNTAGLIESTATLRDGRRPERTVYRVTDAGRAQLVAQLRALVANPDPDRRAFTAALSLLGSLPMPDARDALSARISTIDNAVAALTTHLVGLRERGLPELVLLKLEHELAVQQAERQWIGTVLDRLDSGALDWSGTVRADLLADVMPESSSETGQ